MGKLIIESAGEAKFPRHVFASFRHFSIEKSCSVSLTVRVSEKSVFEPTISKSALGKISVSRASVSNTHFICGKVRNS